jgi:hypothetical protein
VKDKHPDSTLTRRDVYNARALVSREKLGGYNPTAALIKMFDEQGIPHIAKWSEAEPDRLVGLVWTFPYCIRMWTRFSEVLSFDNTYNTNRFKLPLFQVTGQTCLGTVFNAAFGVIDNERREGFQFLAEGVRELASNEGIRFPDVALTDFDQQMKGALDDCFPEAQQQLCIQHINSNVLLNSKKKWVHTGLESGGSDHDSRQTQPTLTRQDRAAAAAAAQSTSTSGPVTHDHDGCKGLQLRARVYSTNCLANAMSLYEW